MVDYFLLGLVSRDGQHYVNAIAGPEESPTQWLLRYNRQRDSTIPQLVLISAIQISEQDAFSALEKGEIFEKYEKRDVLLFTVLRYGHYIYHISGNPLSILIRVRENGKFEAGCAELRLKVIGTSRDLVLGGLQKEFHNQHQQYVDEKGFLEGVALPPISGVLQAFHKNRVVQTREHESHQGNSRSSH